MNMTPEAPMHVACAWVCAIQERAVQSMVSAIACLYETSLEYEGVQAAGLDAQYLVIVPRARS